jgi:hypothetical protein
MMKLAKTRAVAIISGALVSTTLILILWFGVAVHAQNTFLGMSGGRECSMYIGVELRNTSLVLRANDQRAAILLCSSSELGESWFVRFGWGPCFGSEHMMIDAGAFYRMDERTSVGASVTATPWRTGLALSFEVRTGRGR